MHRAGGSKFVDIATRIRLNPEHGGQREETWIQKDDAVDVLNMVPHPKPMVFTGDDDVLYTGC